jgi:hypothetical protein
VISSAAANYRLRPVDLLTIHGFDQPALLRDMAFDQSEGGIDIDALVASGDCLIALATSLDEASDMLTDESEIVRPQLEQLTRTLLYLQRRYKLVPKTPEHRQ